MFNIALGEVIWGGVGSGLYGMIFYVIIAVFIGGLMVGRTPEYLGKKIGAREVKLSAIAVLVPFLVVLAVTAVGGGDPAAGWTARLNSGPHGFSEIFYAFVSQGNNNGSAFAGYTASGPYYGDRRRAAHAGGAVRAAPGRRWPSRGASAAPGPCPRPPGPCTRTRRCSACSSPSSSSSSAP